jgi:hypothetical protein
MMLAGPQSHYAPSAELQPSFKADKTVDSVRQSRCGPRTKARRKAREDWEDQIPSAFGSACRCVPLFADPQRRWCELTENFLRGTLKQRNPSPMRDAF